MRSACTLEPWPVSVIAKQPGRSSAAIAAGALVVALGAEVEHRAAEQPELDAALDEQREVAERERLERRDRAADLALAAVLDGEADRGAARAGELLRPRQHLRAVLLARQVDGGGVARGARATRGRWRGSRRPARRGGRGGRRQGRRARSCHASYPGINTPTPVGCVRVVTQRSSAGERQHRASRGWVGLPRRLDRQVICTLTPTIGVNVQIARTGAPRDSALSPRCGC